MAMARSLPFSPTIELSADTDAGENAWILGDETLLQQVIINLASANRDSERYIGPDALDIDRKGARHLAFGHGFHRCVGAELARMELRTAYPALLQRFPQMRLAVSPESLRFHKLSIVYGVDSLPVAPGPSVTEPA
jgi:cytochrome P450